MAQQLLMTWWEALILGLVQGLTEFLPVSSSAHLVLGEYVLGLNAAGTGSLTFEVFVHFGTILSIFTVYNLRVKELVTETLAASIHPGEWAARFRERPPFRTAVYILITMIPTGITYVLFKDFFERAFDDPELAAGMLLVTGVLLLLTLLRPNPSGELTGGKALLVGVAQSFAMIPGISRSGATICTALYQNVNPERAANFSFLMLLPVVLGATLIKTIELAQQGLGEAWLPLAVGTCAAYGAGILAIKVVIDFVKRGRLQYFAAYCFLVGGLGLWLL
ncbi:undecaprenyl-diphosphate phosphatase [Salisaeta longa]|uniref:undecaprenyl-diphosphate phosphatase n=1 Tax=Salisaeta longa TaxID=503170 RepID=UPI0004086961|nr:undecaprenyl-diphosphate phosphatase [Salisaeta longa]